jgi:DNA (cytosine-5)-methyltransferase 1
MKYLKIVDLFAGIGGLRMGFEAQGCECVFTSEWNKFSAQTYRANHKDDYPIHGDITLVDEKEVPDHDILLAGFPCQPFSLAGVSKKNSLNRLHGFADLTQGTLFFDVARIIALKQPRAFLLENVKNLVSHDKGNTFRVIKDTLTELGYQIHYKVIDAKKFLPQHRERIYIIGFKNRTEFSFNDIQYPDTVPLLGSILHSQDGSEEPDGQYIIEPNGEINSRYTITANLWRYLQAYAEKHRLKGNGFGYSLVDGNNQFTRTLSARYYKDGSEILVSRGTDKTPRRLTPRECARLMGYPDTWKIPVSDTQAYRQFGNSVAVPVIKELARLIVSKIAQNQNDAPTA